MWSDVRLASRQWKRAPVFTAVALLTLALGIGANIAIFNLVDAILLRPLPVPQAGQLTVLTNPVDAGTNFGTSGGRRGLLAYSEYTALRDENTVFSGLLAVQSNGGESPIAWNGAMGPAVIKMVSANYFKVLGVSAYRGRTFAANEGQTIGADPVAVMSYGYWNQHFNRDPGVLGKSFTIHGHPFTVIGVTPPGFFGETVGQSPDLWVPMTMAGETSPGRPELLRDPPGVSRLMWLQVIGRRKPGVSQQTAQAAVNAIFLRLVQQQAGGATDAQQRQQLLNQKLELSDGSKGVTPLRGGAGDGLLELFALVGLLLLLAIVNLASLQLARAAARHKEMGVRLALGAGRGRIIRQLLTESVLLSVTGGLLGILVALWGDRFILAAMPGSGPTGTPLNLTPDWRVLLFVVGLCVLTGVVFGLAPAWRMARLKINTTLQSQGRGGGHGRLWFGKTLAVVQVALSALLLVAAGLFVHSLQKLNDVPLGFNPAQLAEFSLNPGAAGYQGPAAASYLHRALDAINAVPGVHAAAYSMNGLFTGSGCGLPIAIDGYTPGKGQNVGTGCEEVTPRYFAATAIGIVAGRAINEDDQSGGVIHAVVNQTFAQRFFAGRNPLGHIIRDIYPDDHGAVYTIVGVARDAKYNALDEQPRPMMYLPFFNGIGVDPPTDGTVMVSGWSSAVATGVRHAVQSIDPAVTMGAPATVQEQIERSLAGSRVLAQLSGFFALLALFLAGVGLYGTMSFGVARRTSEIGIRMALGASRGRVLGMILGETLLVLLIGLLIGLPGALASAKVLLSAVHINNLKYWDAASYGGAAAALTVALLLAGYLPARRASRIDPWQALREE
ncbi:MAG TPA: ABC transporter permease [Terriglobales bacterium]|nr:ABC transporter permease [Terriglobales bacterium]